MQDTYNFHGKKRFHKSNVLLKNKKINISYNILEYYFIDNEYSNLFNNTFFYDKYNFLIASFYNTNEITKEIKDKIGKITKEYNNYF